jgi:3-oxoacyl-[acyl-carrier protein] reductase
MSSENIMSHPGATQTALVLGAARPFGAEIVARLEKAGYATVAADPAGNDPARAAAPFADLPTLDVLVFNVPVTAGQEKFLEISDADFRLALRDSLYDLVAAGQAAVPRMKQGGRIVHVASRGHLGAWGGAHLMAAGAALVGMSRSMALELASRNIRVNVVAADFAEGKWDNPAARAQVAGTVAYLASDDSALMTGETLLLDGARSLRMSEAAQR